jgi:hypothetical protein
MREFEVERLIPLTSYSAALTGGGAEGVKMCRALKGFVEDEGLEDILEVYGAALPFLATEYERFMRTECEVSALDPIQHVHFILAGYTEKDPENPFRLYLVWTKKKLPQLDGDEIGLAFAVPRIIRLEYRLNQMCRQNAKLDVILPEVQKTLERQGDMQEEIGGPFRYAIITRRGFERVDL